MIIKKHDVLSSSQDDPLIALIKSMTKAEKRNFKLYVNRLSSKSDVKFVLLFDVLDKLGQWEEPTILKKLPNFRKKQLPNIKRHLLKQILISLRLIHIQKNVDIQIREQIDFARILYGKGLYLHSLKILERIQSIAEESHQDLLHLEILEFQKVIEERHITRSRQVENKIESLIDASELRSKIILNSVKLTNLKIEIHGFYIHFGHVKNDRDIRMVKELFHKKLKEIQIESLTFFEKVYLYQCYVWYYYILLDFKNCMDYAKKWTAIFDASLEMKKAEPDLYLRGGHYLLTCLFNLRQRDAFKKALLDYENFEKQFGKNLKTVSKVIYFLYHSTAKLNLFYLEGNFNKGIAFAPKILEKIKTYELHLDPHRILVFYYKIAYQYFGSGDYNTMLDYVNPIINLEFGQLREDLQGYARLIQLIGHYELEHFELLDYLLPTTHRYLEKMKELNELQKETLQFLNKLIKNRNVGHKEIFIEFRDTLIKFQKNKHSRRALVYLDILPWVESKIENKSITKIVKSKLKKS